MLYTPTSGILIDAFYERFLSALLLDFMTSSPISFAIPSAPTSAAHWLGRGKQLCVQGLQIEAPFVFAGRRLSGPWCAAVDVELPARLDGLAGRPGASAYAHLTARQRYAYLNWLAAGRRGKLTEQTMLVTFLAGAEQYLLNEDVTRTPADEADLLEELQQLASAYRTVYPDLAQQCVSLRDYAWVRRHAIGGTSPEVATLGLVQLAGTHPSLALRWIAGAVLARQEPVQGTLAYHFARTYLTGNEYRRLPLYESELHQLFMVRFAERFGNGLPVLDANLSSEVVSYSPVGAPMLGQRTRLSRPSPIFVGSQALRLGVGSLLANCMNQLQDFIQARMEGIAADAAWTKLPVVLWPAPLRDAFRKLIVQALHEPTPVTYEQLAPYFVAGPTMTEKNMTRVVDGLAQLGLATYPQMPFQKPATVRAPFMLYEQDTVAALNKLIDPEEDCWPLALRVVVSEKEAVREQLSERLHAQVQRDAALSLELRRQRRAALAWARSDALKPITRVQWAKVPVSLQDAVTGLLSTLLAPLEDLPATPVMDALLGTRWQTLKSAPLRLDARRVQQLTVETSAVNQLLGDLFSDAEAPAPTIALDTPAPLSNSAVLPGPTTVTPSPVGPGTTARHEFLRRLTSMLDLPDLELHCLAAELSLMAEGTVDWANELAYDVTGQPLLEEFGDGWQVTPGLAQELLEHLGAV